MTGHKSEGYTQRSEVIRRRPDGEGPNPIKRVKKN